MSKGNYNLMNFNPEVPDKNRSVMYREVQCPKLLDYVKKQFSNQGVLKSDETGFFYLKIEDDYVLKLFPMLKEGEEFKKHHLMLPDYFFPGAVGAHISVVYPGECRSKPYIEELGEIFKFEVLDLLEAQIQIVNKRFYVLRVFAAGLESLRNKYSLGSTLSYHGVLVPFHITIAVSLL